jgi:hypothetical protein
MNITIYGWTTRTRAGQAKDRETTTSLAAGWNAPTSVDG